MEKTSRQGAVWPASRIDLGKPSVLDAEFFAEQLGLLLELVVLGGKRTLALMLLAAQPQAATMAK
jgi:hypothetical protein